MPRNKLSKYGNDAKSAASLSTQMTTKVSSTNIKNVRDNANVFEYSMDGTTWKQVQGGGGGATLNDTNTSATSTWSSSKIDSALNVENTKTQFGYVDLTDSSFTTGWTRVVSDLIPLTKKGMALVTIKPYGTTVNIQHMRYNHLKTKTANQANTYYYDVIKTNTFTTVDKSVTTLVTDFDIKGDGHDFIAVSGCYFSQTILQYGYQQFASSFDGSVTQYINSLLPNSYTTWNLNTYKMSYYVTIVSHDRTQRLYGKTVVNLGDSITEGIGAKLIEYPNIIKVETGANVTNCGLGGSSMALTDDSSLTKVVDNLVSATPNWSGLDTYLSNNNRPRMVRNVASIKALDITKVDIITIAYGTNDWNYNKTIDNTSNLLDTSTMCGALRYAVSTLLAKKADLQFYVFAPAYRYQLGAGQTGDSNDTPNSNGKYLKEYADAIQSTCKELGIPCKNMYYESNLNKYNASRLLDDGTHRNDDGYRLLGQQYARFILAN